MFWSSKHPPKPSCVLLILMSELPSYNSKLETQQLKKLFLIPQIISLLQKTCQKLKMTWGPSSFFQFLNFSSEKTNKLKFFCFFRYSFPKEVLKNKEIGTTLTFSVGPKPIHNFRMIERHYYKSQLIQSFDFTFPFCIPNSTNTWECIYKVPKIDEKTRLFIALKHFSFLQNWDSNKFFTKIKK